MESKWNFNVVVDEMSVAFRYKSSSTEKGGMIPLNKPRSFFSKLSETLVSQESFSYNPWQMSQKLFRLKDFYSYTAAM